LTTVTCEQSYFEDTLNFFCQSDLINVFYTQTELNFQRNGL